MSSFDFGPMPRPRLSVDRRSDQRAWVPQDALVELAPGSKRACKVRNMSRKGAMLSLDDATGLPATFGLQLPGDSHRRTARVRWRVATIVGVELVDQPVETGQLRPSPNRARNG